MFNLNFLSSSRFEIPRSDSPSLESGSSPIPDNDTEEEARITEPRAAEEAETTQQEASNSTDTGDKDVKSPLPRRLFSKFRRGSPLNLSRITIAPALTHSPPVQEFRELDMWCRNKLDAIVVSPYEKKYFIPISSVGELEACATKYISVFRDAKGYFIIGSFILQLIARNIWYLSPASKQDIEGSKKDIEREIERSIESVKQKYFIPNLYEESTDPGNAKYYLTLEGARLIESTTNMYVSNKEVEFISVDLFNSITIKPVDKKQVMISRCFVDPAISPDLSFGVVAESFQRLQEETAALNKDVDPQKIGQFIGGAYANHYPVLLDPNSKKLLVPTTINCDAWWTGSLPGFSISIVADGCGLGQRSREAAQKAVEAAKRHICEHLYEHCTLERLTQIVLTAFEIGHKECTKDQYKFQTTTLNIDVSFTSVDEEKYLLAVGLGDTKTYLCIGTTEGPPDIVDLSQFEEFDVTDCGGAIGGYMSSRNEKNERVFITPYLKNLSVVCCKLDPTKNYLVLNMSDGVTNNLSPEFFGLDPREVNFVIDTLHPSLKWEQIKRPGLRLKLITKFSNETLANILSGHTFSIEENVDEICAKIIKHCSEITFAVRGFMEKNVKSKQPATSKEYPGKMDHTTAVGFKILSSVSSGTFSSSTFSSSSSSYNSWSSKTPGMI